MRIIDHPLAESRMIWMREYSPQLMLSLHKQGMLKENVEKEVQIALGIQDRFEKKGLHPEDAQEAALMHVAPSQALPESSSMISNKKYQEIEDEIRS